MSALWAALIALIAGFSIGFFVYGLGVLARQMEPSPRDYMDPLPKGLRPFWPLVQFIRSTLIVFIPDRLLLRVHHRLQRAGMNYLLGAREFVALKVISMLVPLIFVFLFYTAFGLFNIWLSLLAMLVGSFYPDLWLVEQAKRRGRLILKELPVYLDFITLMIEGGLNLTGAMQVAVDKGPLGPLHNEFGIMIRDLRAGTSKMDIFRRFGARVPLPEVRSLVGALIQSEERGGDLGPVLRAQAEQRREERFLRAEKLALEAPVKLLAPLVVFIFPITFLMLAFVIYMKFLQEGGF
ncbi:MAG TPA: type II secretion system F family protein [Acidithiobacillus sp.]|nr:type II secretion system F family protein [Acidithiobacillus sp.]